VTAQQATADNLRPPRPRDKRGRATAANVSEEEEEPPRSPDTEIAELAAAIKELKEGHEAMGSVLETTHKTLVCFRTLLTARRHPVPAPACVTQRERLVDYEHKPLCSS
jgi:hypothetical protein